MHRILVLCTFGWLTFMGTMHFVIDVVSQYLRGKRVPSPETTLYYGLNTAYAVGQVLFGVVGLIIAHQALEMMAQWPMLLLCLLATAAWLAVAFAFIEYREPKIMLGVFGCLALAMAFTR